MKYILMEPMKFVLYRGHYHLSLSTNQLFCTNFIGSISIYFIFYQHQCKILPSEICLTKTLIYITNVQNKQQHGYKFLGSNLYYTEDIITLAYQPINYFAPHIT
jgi:hypothetical protein